MTILDRIPATIRSEDAVYCEECRNLTESYYSAEKCHFCKSVAIIPLLTWLDRKPKPEAK